MSGKSIIFDNTKLEKSNFYKSKRLLKIDDVDYDKILVSKKGSYGTNKSFKYLIGYSDNDDIKPLYIKLPHFQSNKTLSLKVIDNKLSKKYIKIGQNLIVNLFIVLVINK